MNQPIPTRLAAVFIFLCLASTAAADEAVFPPGSRVGLAPPPGFVAGKTFPGFEDRAKNGLILITELPASAYDDLERKVADEQMWKQGVVVEKREPITLNTGPAFLVTGTQQAGGQLFRRWIVVASMPFFTAIVSVQVPDAEKDAVPDATVREALATLAIRATAPADEQLEALPFHLRDLARFRVARVLSGTAALLTEGPADNPELSEQPMVLVVAVVGSAPAQAADRERFARAVLAETPGIKSIRLVRSEPLRMGGQQGHEIVAEAKDAKTDADVMVAQWLRFGHSGHLRVTGMARKEGWGELFSRMRAVRDGIDLR